MNSFSDSTIAELEKNGTKKYYVYCLIDPRDNQVFYIGKGKKIEFSLMKNMHLENLKKS